MSSPTFTWDCIYLRVPAVDISRPPAVHSNAVFHGEVLSNGSCSASTVLLLLILFLPKEEFVFCLFCAHNICSCVVFLPTLCRMRVFATLTSRYLLLLLMDDVILSMLGIRAYCIGVVVDDDDDDIVLLA